MSKFEIVDETSEEESEQEPFLKDEEVTHYIVIKIDTRSGRWISSIHNLEEKILEEKNEDVPKLSVSNITKYFVAVVEFLRTSPDVDRNGNITTKREKEFDEFLKQAKDRKDSDED